MSACPRVLVLTADLDPTADLVLSHLLAREIPFARFDPAAFPVDARLSARLDTGPDWTGGLHTGLREVDLGHVRSVYYRRPGDVQPPEDLADEERSWCARQARAGLWGVLSSLPARWVDAPDRVEFAVNKPRQLAAAAACGLTVPPTLVTNHPADAAAFAEQVGGRIVYKPLHPRVPRDGAGNPTGLAFTVRVPSADWAHSTPEARGRYWTGAPTTRRCPIARREYPRPSRTACGACWPTSVSCSPRSTSPSPRTGPGISST